MFNCCPLEPTPFNISLRINTPTRSCWKTNKQTCAEDGFEVRENSKSYYMTQAASLDCHCVLISRHLGWPNNLSWVPFVLWMIRLWHRVLSILRLTTAISSFLSNPSYSWGLDPSKVDKLHSLYQNPISKFQGKFGFVWHENLHLSLILYIYIPVSICRWLDYGDGK